MIILAAKAITKATTFSILFVYTCIKYPRALPTQKSHQCSEGYLRNQRHMRERYAYLPHMSILLQLQRCVVQELQLSVQLDLSSHNQIITSAGKSAVGRSASSGVIALC